MRFLIDANLPRSTAKKVADYGHDAIDVRDIGLAAATDDAIAAQAKDDDLVLITRDTDFADIRNYPPGDYLGIVVVRLPESATASQILRVLDGFLCDEKPLSSLRHHLLIIEPGRIRIRAS